MNAYLQLVRREFWEHRVFLIVPAIVTAVVVLGFAYTAFVEVPKHLGYAHVVEEISAAGEAQRSHMLSMIPVGIAVPFNIALILVVSFYLLDALYAERKDRSVLFWKSLPVSDTETVLSKFLTALLVLPVITLVAALVATFLMSLIATVVLWLGGGSPWELLWKPAPPLQSIGFLVYAFAVQSLWYAPVFAWLLLASAWARRAPLVWALAPPLALVLLEVMMFQTHRFAEFLGHRLTGVVPTAVRGDHGGPGMIGMSVDGENVHLSGTLLNVADPGALLASPGLWGGIVSAALLVAGAIWLRRYRDET